MTAPTFLLAIAALFALDGASTVYLLSRKGTELNPVMRVLMNAFGTDGALLVVKVGTLVLMAKFGPQLTQAAQWMLLAGYAAAVSWNVLQVLKWKRSH